MFDISLVQPITPRNSGNSKKTFNLFKLKSYFVFFALLVFLRFTHDEFFDAFHWKKFRLKTVCLFQRLIIGQSIQKSCFLERLQVCLLLASEKVVCEECWLSFKAFGVVLHRTVRLDSRIHSQNVNFHHSSWREQTFAAKKIVFCH